MQVSVKKNVIWKKITSESLHFVETLNWDYSLDYNGQIAHYLVVVWVESRFDER